MNKENKLVPEFRFPEFKNEEHWDSTPLDDLCELITKGTTPTTLGYSYTESGVNFIKIESILEGNINLEKAAFISTKCNEAFKRSQLKENDILFSIAGALGVVTTVSKEILPANTNQALSIIRLKNVNQKDYLKAYLKSNIISEEINKIKAGAAQLNISLGQIANFNILIPKNPKEQQKIASCLSSLDEVIAAHSQKLELLKDHKKGLMQNLFPQEGETVPKYRFKEFENDGDWVEKILSEVANYENGKAHEQDISENGKFVVVNSKFISTDAEVVKYSNKAYCLAEKGDVLMVLSDIPNGRAIAKCFYVQEENKYTVNQRICKISSFDCNSLFLYYTMNRNSYFLAFDDGVKQTNLKNDDVQSFPFLIPIDPKEQQKIASCLSSLDAIITAQQEKIEQLKLHKKGLMQGLFPKIKE